MQVLRLPSCEDLTWLYPVFSVFLWTIDFTHGVLKGEEMRAQSLLQLMVDESHQLHDVK